MACCQSVVLPIPASPSNTGAAGPSSSSVARRAVASSSFSRPRRLDRMPKLLHSAGFAGYRFARGWRRKHRETPDSFPAEAGLPSGPMAADSGKSYLVECFWPGIDQEQLATATRRVAQNAAGMRAAGADVRFLGSLL